MHRFIAAVDAGASVAEVASKYLLNQKNTLRPAGKLRPKLRPDGHEKGAAPAGGARGCVRPCPAYALLLVPQPRRGQPACVRLRNVAYTPHRTPPPLLCLPPARRRARV